ncbi:zinc finger protein 3 homolog isoform X4 [Leptidea sinapis]|uniref:zinc finger protein 3 homolog isoform X4 n=1 Tax=Leptidea sinapis TaxID=189913 RepID=UPI0021C4B2EA|nr:zinc finger protein 3 homolog isoform X4 [Leptidea sinapis]
MESNFSDSMCRCCASEGVFKDFNSTYQWMGAEEVYADMLKDCFDITLTVSETINSGGICEVCITQLRNAFNFKKQVQYTEEQFKRKIEEMKFKTEIVKVEEAGEDDFPSDHNLSDDDFSSPEYDIPIIKMESSSESAKSKKRATKGATTRSKKAKTEDGETSAKRFDRRNRKIKLCLNDERAPNGREQGGDKSKEYVKQVLSNSNATPFNWHKDLRFSCYVCSEYYGDPADLKLHTLNFHTSHEIEEHIETSFAIKFDITTLKCNHCNADVETVEDLLKHLIEHHGRHMDKLVNNVLVPFKFHNNLSLCTVCPAEFLKFSSLYEHTKLHFPNLKYECLNEGESVVIANVNKGMMKPSHNNRPNKIIECDKRSPTVSYKNKKETNQKYSLKTEVQCPVLYTCSICSNSFSSSEKLDEHAETHLSIDAFSCKDCDITFKEKSIWLRHIEVHHDTVHTYSETFSSSEKLNKNAEIHLSKDVFSCKYCDITFKQESEWHRHMEVHHYTVYTCSVCSKTFSSSEKLNKHAEIHLSKNITYSCKDCDIMFKQKTVWLRHMEVHHGKNCL